MSLAMRGFACVLGASLLLMVEGCDDALFRMLSDEDADVTGGDSGSLDTNTGGSGGAGSGGAGSGDDGSSGGDDDSGSSSRYHPKGYDDPDQHGPDAKLQAEMCTNCHGATLEGDGDAASCDTCHQKGWRTDCVRCHGGTENETGAPPRDIDGEEVEISFPVHSIHVEENIKPAYGCEQCHAAPEDVLTEGHIFVGDVTAGVSEVDFSGGLSSQGSYSSKVSCSNLYCHGDGQGHNGEMDLTGSAASCDDCHPGPSSGPSGWADMSGRHAVHMEEGLSCGDCHSATTTDGQSISGPTVHVDGEPTVEWDQDMKYDGKSCTGSCHNEEHNARTWQYP